MCTGDNMDTAVAIAIQSGICTQEEIDRRFTDQNSYVCMTGKQFSAAVNGLKQTEAKFGQEQIVGNLKKFR